MGDEKTRLVLTIEEKLSIFNYKESHPEKSFATIANIFTEQWNKKSGSNLQYLIFCEKSYQLKIEFCIKNVFYRLTLHK